MDAKLADTFKSLDTLSAAGRTHRFFRLTRLEELGIARLARLPFSIRVLLENVLRHEDGGAFTSDHVRRLAAYDAHAPSAVEIPFMPARVLMQDFTGVPAIVDLAALRDAMQSLGASASGVAGAADS